MDLNDDYWSKRYIENTTGWDTGNMTAPLKEYIDQLPAKNIAILIPGCGSSYEAQYLLAHGFTNITLIDISTSLCKKLNEKFEAHLGSGIRVICGDFFEHKGAYDLIFEQTFFCALDPHLRSQYAVKMHSLLKPGGKLVGLLFNRQFIDGPPFSGTEQEYRKLFQQYFTIVKMENCYNSILPRKDGELFVILKK
jgi:SAM-dependent methyltransferase